MRFRTTASPQLLGTIKAAFRRGSAFRSQLQLRAFPRKRFPWALSCANSFRLRKIEARESLTFGVACKPAGGLFRRQPDTAFGAAAGENRAAIFGAGAGQKAKLAFPTTFRGLIGRFHILLS